MGRRVHERQDERRCKHQVLYPGQAVPDDLRLGDEISFSTCYHPHKAGPNLVIHAYIKRASSGNIHSLIFRLYIMALILCHAKMFVDKERKKWNAHHIVEASLGSI